MLRHTVFHRCLLVPLNTNLHRLSHQVLNIDVNDEVVYPPIVDMSKEGQQKHQRQLFYNTIKALPTVEQKLDELTTQQRYSLKKFQIFSVPGRYVGVPFNSYITRTHLMDGLPEKLTRINVDKELGEIRSTFCDAVIRYFCRKSEESRSETLTDILLEKGAGSKLVNMLILQCYKKLALKNDYILESTIQQNPRISSFWWHQGFESKSDYIGFKNLCFQYHDFPSFIIRTKKPLSPVVGINDTLCSTPEVPEYNYHPVTCGLFSKSCKKITSAPGYWFGDPYPFPLLLVQSSTIMQKLLNRIEYYDLKKIEDSVGIISSFGWLSSIATYQGFTPFHDVTYPFVTHTILTNGQDWNFYVYQLNTMAFHSDVDKKDRQNLCWTSGKLRLFDTIENGQMKGVNDEVFKILLKCLLNAPEVNKNLNLQPYLGEDDRSEEERHYLRFLLRKKLAGKTDPFAYLHEIPTWRKIYKLHPDAPPCPFVRDE